jgi:sirohydrochlorin cobaltochelatase
LRVYSKTNSALVIVGHGSTINPDSSAPTYAHAENIRKRRIFGEVRCAFWKEEPSLRQIFALVESAVIYIVPNFISEGYFTRKIIPRELELTGRVTQREGRTLIYCEPAGSHPRMTDLLLQRAAEVAPKIPPASTSLVIVGHGTALNDNSAVAVKEQVRKIGALEKYSEVHAAYMEEEPLVSNWPDFTRGQNVVVVPFFVSDGLHSYQDIPVLLGIEKDDAGAASQRDVFRRNPFQLHGRQLFYASAIGTHPGFADVILDQVAAIEKTSQIELPSVARVNRTWERVAADCEKFGEIKIEKKEGSFLLQHRDDFGKPGLHVFTHPSDAIEIARFDDEGVYRPLKSAPNLKHGWQLHLRNSFELLEALDSFYPAMIGTWALRRGIEPVPFRDTADRQSGMYAVVKKIPDETADNLIGRFCRSENGCLKTILWKLRADRGITSLPKTKFDTAVDQLTGCSRGPTTLPMLCTEACNLLVAAARESIKSP